jgi:hypothetical protein
MIVRLKLTTEEISEFHTVRRYNVHTQSTGLQTTVQSTSLSQNLEMLAVQQNMNGMTTLVIFISVHI